MTLAVVIFLLVIGSVLFHFLSPWWFTDLAADWGLIDFTIDVTFWVTGFVFIAINLFLAYCVYKFRQKEGHKAVYEPIVISQAMNLTPISMQISLNSSMVAMPLFFMVFFIIEVANNSKPGMFHIMLGIFGPKLIP